MAERNDDKHQGLDPRYNDDDVETMAHLISDHGVPMLDLLLSEQMTTPKFLHRLLHNNKLREAEATRISVIAQYERQPGDTHGHKPHAPFPMYGHGFEKPKPAST